MMKRTVVGWRVPVLHRGDGCGMEGVGTGQRGWVEDRGGCCRMKGMDAGWKGQG